MFSAQRQAEILRIVRASQTCTISRLAETFSVSDETIRRNIGPLIADGLLVKVHGGVMVPDYLDDAPYQRRILENREAKQAIAASVAALVRDGDSLMLEGGSTCMHIAEALRSHSRLTVVTNAIEIARILAPGSDNRVFMAGGQLRSDDAAAVDESALAFVRQFHVQFAIASVTAIDALGRFMDSLPADAAFSQAIFAQAEQRIAVADHTKFGHSALIHAFGPDTPHMLVTDEEPAPAFAQVFAAAGLEVRLPAIFEKKQNAY
jgi:DeoR family glycerol-3-phosphate regulon repressor